MNSGNFSNSGNGTERLLKYFNIHPINSTVPHHLGYVMIPNIVFKYLNKLGIGGMQSSLAILLMNLIGRDYLKQGSCYPSHSLLAEDMGTEVNNIERGLRKLKQLGLIEIEPRSGKTSMMSNQYTWRGFTEKLRALMIADELIKE